jgi:hypothetical protein
MPVCLPFTGSCRVQRRDSCFRSIEDFARAQSLMDEQLKTDWASALDTCSLRAILYCRNCAFNMLSKRMGHGYCVPGSATTPAFVSPADSPGHDQWARRSRAKATFAAPRRTKLSAISKVRSEACASSTGRARTRSGFTQMIAPYCAGGDANCTRAVPCLPAQGRGKMKG